MRELGFDSLVCKTHWDVKEEKTKHTTQRRLLRLLFVMITAFIVLASMFTAKAGAAVYYISPNGSDSNPGTSSSPWRTFSFAIPRLQPADTLLLKNGTYTLSNSGLPNINCAAGARNGTASHRITLKAENERQAWLKGDGSTHTLVVTGCSYWTIEGLRISSADNSAARSNTHVLVLDSSSNLQIRRALLHHNNRYLNSHLLAMWSTVDTLIEESEFYAFHRHGLSATDSHRNTVRRNYFNGRRHADISGGYGSNTPIGGDSAFVFYPGNDNIAENNVVEDALCTGAVAGPGVGPKNNKMYGIICRGGFYGIDTYSYGDSEAAMNLDMLWQDSVLIANQTDGFGALGARMPRGWIYRNITVLNPAGMGVMTSIGVPGWQCCKPFNVTYENVLISGAAGGGFILDSDNISHTINNSNVYNSGNSSGSYSGNGFTTKNPNLGACMVFIPDGSPMKNAGLGGADIGANVLYRYENGVLTSQPLWDPITGEFPHGAIVPGINDIPGSSAFDVHRRLNVNANGCSLPAGYGGKTVDPEPGLPVVSRPSPPRNLQVVR